LSTLASLEPLLEIEDPYAAEFRAPDVSLTVAVRVRASAWDAWTVFETERLTVGAGDARRYEESPQADGSVLRTGARLSLLRSNQRWEEVAYDFVAPEWTFIDRRHLSGPLVREVCVGRIRDLGDEREASFTIHTWARGRAARHILKASRGSVKRSIERVYRDLAQQLDERLEHGPASAPSQAALRAIIGPRPPVLPRKARRLLDDTRANFSSTRFAEALIDTLAKAPLVEQDRMEPRVLAHSWDLPEDEVIVGCLEGVREGVLALRWDLLCPSCEGAKARWTTLDDTGEEVHCASCNIRYDAAFLDAVAVSFRPSPAIRDFQYERQCIGSPSHTPHVLARIRLEPGADRAFEIDLAPGSYRLRELGGLHAANLEVTANAEERALAVELGERHILPAALRVLPGRCTVALRSRLSVPGQVVLETRWRPPTTLTAAQLLSHAKARALVPAEALGPTLNVEYRRSSILVCELFGRGDAGERVAGVLSSHAPSLITTQGRHLIALWNDFDEALRAAKQLDGMLEACSAAGRGTILYTWENACPAGEAMEEALAALQIAVPGFATLPRGCAQDNKVQAALKHAATRARLIPGPRIRDRQDYLISFPRAARGPSPTASTLSLEVSERLLEGERLLERYRLGDTIGEGGTGTVYEAIDEHEGHRVVVKVFKPILARSAPLLQQCFYEARTCSLIDHPNVVKLVDFGHTDTGRPLLVMERLDGVELKALLLEGGALDVTSTCLIWRDIAAALEAVHALGVLHRDVKPANIVLSRDEPVRAKLIDFGIALDLARLETSVADRSGTPLYASPEQLRRRKPSPRSDLYALGLTLYECLTGTLPNASLPRALALELRVSEPLPPIDTVMKAPPPQLLGYVIDRCLAIDPEDRLASATEVREILDELLQTLPKTAASTGE
jgi:hypothetical protein